MNKLAAQAAIDFIDTTLQAEIPILRRIDERKRSKAHLFELGPSGKQFAVIVGNFDPTKGKFDLQQTRVLLECAPPDLPDVEAMPANDYYNGGSVKKRSNSRLAPPRQWSVLVGSETGLRSLLGWYSSTPAVLPRAQIGRASCRERV